MGLLAGMARCLILLLVLRMIAAPLALRPGSPASGSNSHYIVRVCAWPAQRLQRTPPVALILRRHLGGDPGADHDPDFRPRHHDPCPLTRTSPRRNGQDAVSSSLVGPLRC